jgi:hypothetical protein
MILAQQYNRLCEYLSHCVDPMIFARVTNALLQVCFQSKIVHHTLMGNGHGQKEYDISKLDT